MARPARSTPRWRHRFVTGCLLLLLSLQGVQLGFHLLWHASAPPATGHRLDDRAPCEQCRMLDDISIQTVVASVQVVPRLVIVSAEADPPCATGSGTSPRAAARAPPSSPLV